MASIVHETLNEVLSVATRNQNWDDRRGGQRTWSIELDLSTIPFNATDTYRWRFDKDAVAPWANHVVVMYRGITTTGNKSLSVYWSHDGVTLSNLCLDSSFDGGTAQDTGTGTTLRLSAGLAAGQHIIALDNDDANQTTAVLSILFKAGR